MWSRLHHGQSGTVDLRVAVRVNHDQVSHRITAAVNTSDNVVNVPPRVFRDALVADTTGTLLCEPKPNQLLSAVKRAQYLETLAFFEVAFPGRVEGVRLRLDFCVSSDWNLSRITKCCHDGLAIWPPCPRFSSKDPVPCTNASKVSMLNPVASLVGVPATTPLP